jgi:hypothetical protein
MATIYKKVFDPIAEGNPAPIVNPTGEIMDCLECGYAVSSADGLCTDCWYYRHDARLNSDGAGETGSKPTAH